MTSDFGKLTSFENGAPLTKLLICLILFKLLICLILFNVVVYEVLSPLGGMAISKTFRLLRVLSPLGGMAIHLGM
jgi:hypothetical protein